MENCLFCKIIKEDIPCYKIYEDEFTLAFLDISNNPEGHTLVVPKVHAENLFDVNEQVYKAVENTVRKVSKHYKDIGYADGINTYINSGKQAGQEVMHLHVHIIPRKENDGIVFSHTPNVSKQELSKTQEKLKLNN